MFFVATDRSSGEVYFGTCTTNCRAFIQYWQFEQICCQKSTYWVVSCWKCSINNNQSNTQQMKHCGEKFQYIDGCKLYCFVRLRIFAEEATHSKCIKIHITKQDVFKKRKVSRWKDYTGVNWSFTKGWGGTLTLTNLSSILYRWTV